MILQYFKKKENKEQIIAIEQYKKILVESNLFLNENNFFKIKNYKISFEIVSIFLIMFIRINLLEYNRKLYMKVNDELLSLFICDLDESLREKGIGDMSIGKYVKSYVKKFYFRLTKFPISEKAINPDTIRAYFEKFKIINLGEERNASKSFYSLFEDILHNNK